MRGGGGKKRGDEGERVEIVGSERVDVLKDSGKERKAKATSSNLMMGSKRVRILLLIEKEGRG